MWFESASDVSTQIHPATRFTPTETLHAPVADVIITCDSLKDDSGKQKGRKQAVKWRKFMEIKLEERKIKYGDAIKRNAVDKGSDEGFRKHTFLYTINVVLMMLKI